MKTIVYLFVAFFIMFSCVDYSSDWEKIYEQPDFADFVGEWKIIEPTYKNLEEKSGLEIERKGSLIIRQDSSLTFQNLPAVFDFTEVYSPVHYFTADGNCSFVESKDYWWIRFKLKKNEEVKSLSYFTNTILLSNREDSRLRLKHTTRAETVVVFEKMK